MGTFLIANLGIPKFLQSIPVISKHRNLCAVSSARGISNILLLADKELLEQYQSTG
jgi:hypothetical protein